MKLISRQKNSIIQVAEVNQLASDPAAFVCACEKGYHHQIEEIVDLVVESDGGYRVVMLAGPSSSGKTTTAHKISQEFSRRGISSPVVSLDDFFLGMEFYPKLPDGTPDMEAVEALDLPLINITLKKLIETGGATFPTFDFERSCRSEAVKEISLGEKGVLVVEGLHAINPRLFEVLDRSSLFRVYISARTVYLDGEAEVLCPKDARLIRRMVRDHNFRNRSPLETLLTWEDVLDGEEKYIHPFRDLVDYKIDSALDYEACVFHHYIVPMLGTMKNEWVFEGKVRQIVEILEAFDDIDHQYIPIDSLLREFIGWNDIRQVEEKVV